MDTRQKQINQTTIKHIPTKHRANDEKKRWEHCQNDKPLTIKHIPQNNRAHRTKKWLMDTQSKR